MVMLAPCERYQIIKRHDVMTGSPRLRHTGLGAPAVWTPMVDSFPGPVVGVVVLGGFHSVLISVGATWLHVLGGDVVGVQCASGR
jgi:hypothetical protein